MISRSHPLLRMVFLFLLGCLSLPLLARSASVGDKPVSTEDVIGMTRVGLSDQIIIAKIRAHNKPADLSTDDLIELKKAHVSDAVISALLDPTTAQANGDSRNALSGATSGITGDLNDPMSPHESGIWVYGKDVNGKPVMIELERTAYQGAKTGGIFASGVTYGVVKAKSKAIIPGESASIRVTESNPTFYFYFDNKAAGIGGNSVFSAQNISDPNQFALIRLQVEKHAREAEIGEFSIWGASSGTDRKRTMTFRSERVRPGLYKVVLDGEMRSGEYCFMTAPAAVSSYAGGMAGTTAASNLFDFGVELGSASGTRVVPAGKAGTWDR